MAVPLEGIDAERARDLLFDAWWWVAPDRLRRAHDPEAPGA